MVPTALRVTAVVAVMAACGTGDNTGQAELTITQQVRGDTVIVTSEGDPEVTTIDEVEILWRDAELYAPNSIHLAGDLLIIRDWMQLHLLRVTGEHVATVGKSGRGPGEFSNVGSIGAWLDTIVVYDNGIGRLTYYDSTGRLLGDRPFRPRGGLSSTEPMRAWREGVLAVVGIDASVGRWSTTVRHELRWYDLEADTFAALRRWDIPEDQRSAELGEGVFGNRQTFGPERVMTTGQGPNVAVGNRVDHCIAVHSPQVSRVRHVCRTRQRIPVGPAAHNPDLSQFGEISKRFFRGRTIADSLPSYHLFRFAEDGSLWVWTMSAELANVHPTILASHPELGPTHHEWDVFDPQGRLVRTFRLPKAFHLHAGVMTAEHAYGLYELDTGELVIGAIALPPTADSAVEQQGSRPR